MLLAFGSAAGTPAAFTRAAETVGIDGNGFLAEGQPEMSAVILAGSTGGTTRSLSEAPIGSAEWLPQGLPEGAGPAAIGVADPEAAVDASAVDTGLEGTEPQLSALLFLSDTHGASENTPARGNQQKKSNAAAMQN